MPGGIDQGRFAEIRVTGRFSLTDGEAEELREPADIRLRRCLRNGGAMYEYRTTVCSDPALRDLGNKSLEDLKGLAERFDVTITGHSGRKATFLEPIQEHAASLPTEEAWTTAPNKLVGALPHLITFRDDDPEAAIRQALMGVYRSVLQDDQITTQLSAVESHTRDVLKNEANKLRDHLRLRCPELADIRINPQISFRDQFPTVRIEAGRLATELVGLGASGAGRRQRIALATWEFTQQVLKETAGPERSLVVCYDEPDTHLDYMHQRQLADLIREQTLLPGVQVIVATHSLNLIDKVPIENVIHLAHHNGRSDAQMLLGDDHEGTDLFLSNVAASVDLRTSVLLHERCFVGVEGVTEAQALPVLFRLAVGLPLQSAGLALIAASGNAGALLLARHLVSRGRSVRIIVDEDTFNSTSTKRKFRDAALRGHGIDPSHVFRVGTTELEDLFPDEQWAATANECWPREDGRAWEPKDSADLRQRSKFSSAVRDAVLSAAPASAPEEKPGYLVALAHRLREPEEVPQQLRDIFAELILAAD